MLILAFLFLIGVASIGYEAAAPKDVVERYAKDMSAPVVRLNRGKIPVTMIDRRTGIPYPHPTYTVTTFKTLKEGGHAATGEHKFTLVVKTEVPKPDEGREPDPKKKDVPADEPTTSSRSTWPPGTTPRGTWSGWRTARTSTPGSGTWRLR